MREIYWRWKPSAASHRGQLDIPKDHNSEWFLFQQVLFRRVIIPKFLFIPKGHYSGKFNPEGSLFRRFLFRRVVIPKFVMTIRDNSLQNNYPSGCKPFETTTLRNNIDMHPKSQVRISVTYPMSSSGPPFRWSELYSWPIYFQQRSESLEMIQVSTILIHINMFTGLSSHCTREWHSVYLST